MLEGEGLCASPVYTSTFHAYRDLMRDRRPSGSARSAVSTVSVARQLGEGLHRILGGGSSAGGASSRRKSRARKRDWNSQGRYFHVDGMHPLVAERWCICPEHKMVPVRQLVSILDMHQGEFRKVLV
jgi:hypothetical protein